MKSILAFSALAFFISTATANAEFNLANGTYRWDLGKNCSFLTIKNNKPAAYKSHQPCKNGSTWTPGSMSRSGDTIKIQQATFRIQSATPTGMTGLWRLGNFSKVITFSK